MARSTAFDSEGRPETDAEFHRRVQDSITRDSWIGRDDTGARAPQRGIVHEIGGGTDRQVHIYKD